MQVALSWEVSPQVLDALSAMQFDTPPLHFATDKPTVSASSSEASPLRLRASHSAADGDGQHAALQAAQAMSGRLDAAAEAVAGVSSELADVILVLQSAKEEKDAVLQRNRSVEHTCRALWDGEADSNSFVAQAQVRTRALRVACQCHACTRRCSSSLRLSSRA